MSKIYRVTRYFARKFQENRRTKKWRKGNDPFVREQLDKLDSLKNKHKNEKCFVIGNGPSINNMNLNLMKDSVTIACNSFYLKHNELNFLPTYYTVEDPLPAEDNKNEITQLENTTKIIPYDLKKFIKKESNAIYINFLRSYARPNRNGFPYFSFELDKKSYWGGTVLYLSLQIAAHIGCNPIYLIGVDLSYDIPDNVEKNGKVLTSTGDDPNHFDPSYFGKGKRWHLPFVERMQNSFEKAYHELNKRGLSVYNATKGGNLKNIPRKEYESIFLS